MVRRRASFYFLLVGLAAFACCGALLAACSAPASSRKQAASTDHGAPPPSTAPSGAWNFYGVNFELAGFEPFAKTDTAALLKVLEPATIRWPGGTEANFYDWHSGQSTQKPTKTPFTLGDLAAACRASGAVPIFDLNVLSPANRTNPSDQIAMLQAAQRLGLPVRYVEVGNELYSNAPGVPEAFPDGTTYARTVSIYVQALHQAFPGVQVAADTIPFAADERERSWDAQLLAAATGSGAPDALVVHFYPGLYQKPFVLSDVPALFENLFSSVQQLSQAIQGLGTRPVWLTEYNMRGPYSLFRKEGMPPAEKDYAHELYLAAFAAMLPRVPGVALVDNWTALADGFYGAWQNPSAPHLSPAGQAVQMVNSAAKGASRAESVSLPGVPQLPGGQPGVVAESFVRPGMTPSALIVNLTSNRVTVPTGGWLVPGSHYEQVSGLPTTSEAVAPVPVSAVVSSGSLVLPPWSISAIGA
jgi:hypothetical protein